MASPMAGKESYWQTRKRSKEEHIRGLPKWRIQAQLFDISEGFHLIEPAATDDPYLCSRHILSFKTTLGTHASSVLFARECPRAFQVRDGFRTFPACASPPRRSVVFQGARASGSTLEACVPRLPTQAAYLEGAPSGVAPPELAGA